MMSVREYLDSFVKKHKFNKEITVRCFGGKTFDDIRSVVFNKEDIPSGKRISLEDIMYDVDSDLPADVFLRWLEYCDNHKDNEVSYIYWMTKMDNAYEPMNIDKHESEKFKEDIMSMVEKLKTSLIGDIPL